MDIPIGAGLKWILVEGVVLLGGKNLRWISLDEGGGGDAQQGKMVFWLR